MSSKNIKCFFMLIIARFIISITLNSIVKKANLFFRVFPDFSGCFYSRNEIVLEFKLLKLINYFIFRLVNKSKRAMQAKGENMQGEKQELQRIANDSANSACHTGLSHCISRWRQKSESLAKDGNSVKKHNIISDFSENLFWDTDVQKLDMERHKKYIIARVIEYGTFHDWLLLCNYFTLEEVIRIAQSLRSIDPKTVAFLSVVGNVPLEDFRCCTSKQSSRKHWIY